MSSNRSSERGEPLGADLAIPALALGFAVYFLLSTADLTWEANANGVLIGTILAVLVLVQCVRIGVAAAKGAGTLRFDPLVQPRDALPKRVGMVLLTVAFIAALKWLGLTLALLLAMLAGLYLMGVRKRPALVGVSFGVAAAAYLMFVALFNSDIPHGPVEKFLAALF